MYFGLFSEIFWIGILQKNKIVFIFLLSLSPNVKDHAIYNFNFFSALGLPTY